MDKIWFKPDNTKLLPLFGNKVEVRANICLDCGTIELVGDADKAQSLAEAAKPK
jgi:ferredoxin-like protein FixX